MMAYKRNPRSKDRYVFHHVVDDFISDPHFPYFVSFPRTGSHWFRIFMERYTGTPSLVQSFTIKSPKSFWSYHRHDKDLKEVGQRNKVLYLYRNPVDTIFSQISYERENMDKDSVNLYIEMYSNHILKWLYNNKAENFLSFTYEGLKEDPVSEIYKILLFLDMEINDERITDCYSKSQKNLTKKVTGDSNFGVINLSDNYEQERDKFKKEYSEYIFNSFLSIDSRLRW